ncbi:hypothetical protein F5I97DRAFT_1997047 [Phlebopus sp. FC_14]|nr:hypothetical protein F5I97DRAFT_1997047 [Phlebopus sp. FC_14]
MPGMESPLHVAHQHAANAEDYRNEGLFIPAADEHFKAARAFKECGEKSTDSNTKRTLNMLCNEHTKAGKDLERRISKLREENKDPTLPQKASPQRAQIYPATSPSPLASGSQRLMESQNNVDESFMVLGQRSAAQQSDPGDAFNQFWKIMEGMLDNLSQPVAFTTAPLGTEPNLPVRKGLLRDGSSSSDTDRDEPFASKFSRKLGRDAKAKSKQDVLVEETDEEVLADPGDDLSESFCLIPSGPEPSISALQGANVVLKQEIEEMRRRLAAAERTMQMRKEQHQQLRDSIVMARHQAQRAMGASLMLQRPSGQQPTVDLSTLNINLPAIPAPMTALTAGRDREAQHLRRIRELEEELRAVRTENDKQKVMIARFRERWEKLKESAKRKKDAKAAAAKTSVGDRIQEEPEVEQELDEENRN